MEIPYFPFVIPLIVGVIVQTMKLVIDAVKYKRVTFRNIRIAGGFPSVHSGLSSSITTLIFLQE
jgi:acid phosphatase family membrane protein YuiD